MNTNLRILVVDDDALMRDALGHHHAERSTICRNGHVGGGYVSCNGLGALAQALGKGAGKGICRHPFDGDQLITWRWI